MNKLTKGSNMRWESSRMMLPEHVQVLRQTHADLEKIDRPLLDEQELEKLNRTLCEAMSGRKRITLSYYKNGYIEVSICCVEKLDPIERQLKISDLYGLSRHISFTDIVGAKLNDPAQGSFSDA